MNVVIFRPGSARRRTVFENQLLLYSYLQREYGWEFTIVVDEESHEEDPRFQWVVLKESQWKSFRGRRWFLGKSRKLRRLMEVCASADAILTIDPAVYPQAHLAFEVGRRLDLPVSFDATITLQSEQLFGRWSRAAYRKVLVDIEGCHRILVPTPKVIERFSHLRLVSKGVLGKFRMLGHAVDTQNFVPLSRGGASGDGRTILCVSRLLPEKGIAYILEAFLAIADEVPDSRMVFLGVGVMDSYIRMRIPLGYIGNRVHIVPEVSHADLPRYYQSAIAYVAHALETPRWEEYFGIANLEAMACGIPVILSRSGAIPCVVRSPATALWAEQRCITDIERHLRHVLAMDDFERLGTAAANRQYVVDKYSVESVAHRFHAALGE